MLTKYSQATKGTSGHMFCGIGGDTEGFREAGWDIAFGANHSKRNIETFAANFTDAVPLCQDMDRYDMRNLPRAQVLFASPICTEISPAGGRRRKQAKKKTQGQIALMEHGEVEEEVWERTRATAYDILRAAEVWGYDAICGENVIEFATDWPLFDWWLQAFDILGYNHTITCVSSAHIAGDGNPAAPQWRDRVYFAFTRKGITKPDLTPRPSAICPGCDEQVAAVQSWRDPRKRKLGKYRQQYDYVSPHIGCRNPIVEPFVRPVFEAIDWSNLGPKMSERKQGYAPATIARVERGLRDHGGMALLNPAGGTWNYYSDCRVIDVPAPTLQTREAYAVVSPEPFVTILRKNCTAQSVREPLGTIASGGNHHYVTTPPGAGVTVEQIRNTLVSPYYSTGVPKPVTQPVDTLTTKDRFALLAMAPTVAECRYRMFTPREQARSQRFNDTYVLTGTLGEQTAGVGNAVSVNVSRWVGSRVMAVLDSAGAASGSAA